MRPSAVATLAALSLFATSAAADPRAERLALDAAHAEYWWAGFTGVYTASALVQTGLALGATDEGDRVDAIVNAASSWLGVGGQVVLSPIPQVWRAHSDALHGRSLELSLARAAQAEAEGRAWYNHAACAAVALGAGATLWLAFDRPESAALTFATNLVVGELNLFTQPSRVMRDRASTTVAWSVVPTAHGAAWVAVW